MQIIDEVMVWHFQRRLGMAKSDSASIGSHDKWKRGHRTFVQHKAFMDKCL